MDPGAALRLEGPGRLPRGSVTERSVYRLRGYVGKEGL